MDLTNKKINLEYEFNKLEDSFYNIDMGLLQHPELVQFARELEKYKNKLLEYNASNIQNANASNLDFINVLQLGVKK